MQTCCMQVNSHPYLNQAANNGGSRQTTPAVHHRTLPRAGRSERGLRSCAKKCSRAADAGPPEYASANWSPGRMSECTRTALRTCGQRMRRCHGLATGEGATAEWQTGGS